MTDEVKLEPGEYDLMGQLAQFAARRLAQDPNSNGVYLNKMYSKSLGAPLLLIVALGEQALAVEQVLMRGAVSENALDSILLTPGGNTFLRDN